MKRSRKSAVIAGRAIAALLWLPLCLPASAADPGMPGGIFSFGAGARPLGMGGAYSAAARDATALYYNPAGLSFMSSRNISLMHAALFETASYDYAAYGQNFSKLPGAWGAQVMRLGAGSADGRDENNLPTQSFTYSETALAAGAGVRGLFFPFLSLGGSVKMLSRSLEGSADTLVGLDLGAQYGPIADNKLTLALLFQNLAGFASGDTSDKMPVGYKLGAAYNARPKLLFCADVSDLNQVNLGAEYLLGSGALRLGYGDGGFSYGAGLKFMKSYQVDLAMFKHETLGLSNRISLAYYFGGVSAPPKVKTHAPEYLAKAETDIKKRDYVPAFDNVDMAIGMDPNVKKGPWGEKIMRLGDLVTRLKLRELPERREQLKAGTDQAVEAGLAVNEILAGNNARGMLLAHSALGYKPGDAFFADFLKEMSGMTGQPVKGDEVMPRNAMAKEKLRKAETYFQMQEYDKAAKECEAVLQLEDDNALAWTRLGSAYFAIGDMDRARRAFERSLKLDPDNASVVSFMRLQGW